ncbi:hypothetical protein HYC85_032343 [Camellia sinensis]|uniref:K+ potassium transporter integral membrane domain-containing protein n=1 Tax=Camellia sinensis TaxID=4442 RepID=A0A7J7FSV6_CAMSI|nr:hypothetical protein HYC85_032343 [Camellia sinensis]
MKEGKRWGVVLHLAFQSIGVVYGDIGTSPLYVCASTFSSGINHNDDILGVMSLIIYTLTLIPLFKYVLVVLRANYNGNGGTFALYSLICRYAQVGLVPSQEAEDRDVSTFSLELPNPPPNPNNRVLSAARLESKLEKSIFAKSFLLFATMLGTSMVIGDGILTPCISVKTASLTPQERAELKRFLWRRGGWATTTPEVTAAAARRSEAAVRSPLLSSFSCGA